LSRDSDRMVRSCAIAALGQTTPTDETRRCLIEALRDKDTRVQANAIEAIEVQKLNDLTPALEPLMQSSNNRLRANAIKALLTWKVASAQQAIEQMVSDSRSQHRRSAQWLISQLKPQTKQSLAALADASLLETVS